MRVPPRLTLGLLFATLASAQGFSVLGPLKNEANHAPLPWQGRGFAGLPGGLGYDLAGDIGGPMFIDEAYRWNVPTVFYGFDDTFLDYFGPDGVEAVEAAVATLNALPAASDLQPDLSEFPLDSLGINATAETLQLLDLKSWALAALLEQLGLANPERFVWGLRSRTRDPECITDPLCEHLVMLNYDPLDAKPSAYVNGSHYNPVIFDDLGPADNRWASAVEWNTFDLERAPYSSVAGGLGSPDFQFVNGLGVTSVQPLRAGTYFAGLTRDDVGGLRHLLRRDRRVWETLLPDVTSADANGLPAVRDALRGGVEKVNLVRLSWDPVHRRFIPGLRSFPDVFFTNNIAVTQSVQRLVSAPDILFRAADLGGALYRDPWQNGAPIFSPKILDRGSPVRWQNHADMNPSSQGGGPGVITPGGVITLNKLGRYFANPGIQWGSFDGSDRLPHVIRGSETNHSAVTLESRVIQTNGLPQLEWTVLLSRDWNQRYFRIETSPDLRQWEASAWLDSGDPDAAIVTWRAPATNQHQFFRVQKAAGWGE